MRLWTKYLDRAAVNDVINVKTDDGNNIRSRKTAMESRDAERQRRQRLEDVRDEQARRTAKGHQ